MIFPVSIIKQYGVFFNLWLDFVSTGCVETQGLSSEKLLETVLLRMVLIYDFCWKESLEASPEIRAWLVPFETDALGVALNAINKREIHLNYFGEKG